jgi:glycerol-3-phosphate O-acyltransferase
MRLYVRGGRDRLGRAVVEVGSPVSFREYAAVRGLDLRVLEREDRIQEVSRFAEEMMRRISDVSPILPVPLLSHVLLESGEELSRDMLESEVETLIKTLLQREARLPVTDAAQVVEEGLRMLLLRKLVVSRGGTYGIPSDKREVLRYYANALAAVMDIGRVNS